MEGGYSNCARMLLSWDNLLLRLLIFSEKREKTFRKFIPLETFKKSSKSMCSDFFRVKSGSLEKSSYIFNSSVKSGVFQLIEGLGRFKCKYNQEVFDIYENERKN